jgi:hypothetical protein
MPWDLVADPVHHPDDVVSYRHIEAVLVDPQRKMHILSGIAVPAFEVNDDEQI